VPRHFFCLDFLLLHEVDCHDNHVARDFQHGNHGTWVLVWFKEGEHFGVFLIILQCKCAFVQFGSYALLHLRFELSLEYMCNASGPSFPYLRFSEFSAIPYHCVGWLG
jgi:hypothetical protein